MSQGLRVAYVLTFDPSRHEGIWARLKERLEVWSDLGVEANLIVACRKDSALAQISEVAGHRVTALTGLNSFMASFKLFAAVGNAQPDVIYMRYNLPYPGMIFVARSFRTILEVHADDRIESKHMPWRYRIVSASLRSQLLRRVAGFVFVDPDLLGGDAFPAHGRPVISITNGIRVPPGPTPERPKGHVRFVFVVGNSAPWHGTSKVFELARLMPEFEFHVVGFKDADFRGPGNVILHPLLAQRDLARLYGDCHIGIGSLGLEEVSRPHASPLKVREYLAAGLPCVIAYEDPDLVGCPDVLNLGYGFEPDAASVLRLRRFAVEWAGRGASGETQRRVDIRHKEERRVAFLEGAVLGHGG